MLYAHRRALTGLTGLLGSLLLVAVASAHGVISPHGLIMTVGHYRCELNRSVQVRHVTPDRQSAVLHWNRQDYTMHAVEARSGALRYEDPHSGLVWLTIPGKSMLLDSRQGRQLANECTT